MQTLLLLSHWSEHRGTHNMADMIVVLQWFTSQLIRAGQVYIWASLLLELINIPLKCGKHSVAMFHLQMIYQLQSIGIKPGCQLLVCVGPRQLKHQEWPGQGHWLSSKIYQTTCLLLSYIWQGYAAPVGMMGQMDYTFLCIIMMCVFRYNHYICAYNFFQEQSFIPLECKCNKQPVGIGVGSIWGNKQIYAALYKSLCVSRKIHSKEIHPWAPPFPRANGFRVVPGVQHYQQWVSETALKA